MTSLIVFTCIYTPVFISFHDEEPGLSSAEVTNIVVDAIFGMDIFVVFFTAFYDDDYHLVDDMKDIARNYIFGWFLLDIVAITPFDQFKSTDEDNNNSGNMGSIVRIAKLGRMQKLIKLTRLIRIIKILKQKNSVLKQVS